MTISFLEFLFILIIGQCVFLIFAIQYIPKKNTGANRMIQYLLAIYTFYLLERVIGCLIVGCQVNKFHFLINIFYLFIGPFVYTYIRRLLFYEYRQYRLSYYHYVPVFIYLLYAVFHIYIFNRIEDLSSYLTNLFYTVEIVFFISITAYLIKSYRLFIYYKNNENRELSFNPISIKYIRIMLLCLAMYMLFWLLGILELFDIIGWIKRSTIYDISCFIFGVQIYIVSFYSLKYPEVFKIQYPSNDKSKSKKTNHLNEKEVLTIKNLLYKFFEEDKGYRQPDLSLSILANKIDTTPNKLSWVLNNSYEKTFYDLVNEHRVKEFLDRINQNHHKELTLLSIAFDVGFNSKSTFYKAFKEITQLTPTAYIKKIENSDV